MLLMHQSGTYCITIKLRICHTLIIVGIMSNDMMHILINSNDIHRYKSLSCSKLESKLLPNKKQHDSSQ